MNLPPIIGVGLETSEKSGDAAQGEREAGPWVSGSNSKAAARGRVQVQGLELGLRPGVCEAH